MTPTFLRRCLLLTLPTLSACALIFPPEVGPTAEILNSRYVTDEQRAAVAALSALDDDPVIRKAKADEAAWNAMRGAQHKEKPGDVPG